MSRRQNTHQPYGEQSQTGTSQPMLNPNAQLNQQMNAAMQAPQISTLQPPYAQSHGTPNNLDRVNFKYLW